MRRQIAFIFFSTVFLTFVVFLLLPTLSIPTRQPHNSVKTRVATIQNSVRHARGNAQTNNPGYVCEYPPQPNVYETEHFFINYDKLGRGLTIEDYGDALEEAYQVQVEEYGWAAPPLCVEGERECEKVNPWGKYPVQIYDLSGDEGDYDGFVNIVGDYAGVVGDNPNTPARERAAAATCMVIHSYPRQPDDFTKLEYVYGTAQHEFQHMIQYGYIGEGFDKNGNAIFNNMWYESIATYFEEETADDVNFPNSLLWSNHTACLADYDRTGDPYQNWLFFRYVAEQHGGANRADGGENVLQLFWEKAVTGTNAVGTMDEVLHEYGTTLDDTFHTYAAAYAFSKSCGRGYTAPYCFEEGSEYVDWAGVPEREDIIKRATGVYRGTIREGYSMNFIDVPVGSAYAITLDNTARGGILRASLVCDTGSSLNITPFPDYEVPSGSESTISRYEAEDCEQATVVITSHTNSDACTARAYRVTLGDPSDTLPPTATVRPRATPRPTEVTNAAPTRQPSTRPPRSDGESASASDEESDIDDLLSCIPGMVALLALAVWRRRVL